MAAGPAPQHLTPELGKALSRLQVFLPDAPPRVLEAHPGDDVIHVFTDGASETEGVTVGAMFFLNGALPEFLAERVPAGLVEEWRSSGKWQVIGQAELLPVLLAAVVWAEFLRNRYVVFWLGQDAARQGLTKGYSPSEHSAAYRRGITTLGFASSVSVVCAGPLP